MLSSIIDASKKNLIKGIDNLVCMTASLSTGHPEFEFHESDPQCQLLLNKVLIPGWYNFQFDIEIKEGKIRNSKLYFDSGSGYNEADTVLLTQTNGLLSKTLIYFPKKIEK